MENPSSFHNFEVMFEIMAMEENLMGDGFNGYWWLFY